MAGSGYTRQSVASIVPTAVVRAAPINAEFDKLRDAFTQSDTGTTGHRHDGSSDEGSYVPFIADLDKQNYLTVDQTNNLFGLFIEVGGTPVEQLRFQDGVVVPVTDNDIDLGTSLLEYKNVYVDGTAYIDTASIGDNDYTTITDNEYDVSSGDFTLDVAGDIIFDADGADIFLKDAGTTYATLTNNLGNLILKSNTTTAVTFTDANADFAGTLDVTGAATFDSTVLVKGNTTLGDAATDTVTFTADVASPIIPSADDTYDLGAVGSEWRNLYIDGTANIDSLVADTADINAGTIDNTVIGGTTAAAADFTTMDASGNATVGGTFAVTGATTLSSTLDVTGATGIDGDFDINTNKFTVASASGNTTVAGTLGVTGASTLTGNTTVGGTLGVTGAATLNDNLTVSGNATVGGNLTVNGTLNTLNTTNTVISDTLIELGNGVTGTPTNDSGIVIERGSADNAFIGFDESADKFIMGTGSFTGASTGDLTVTKGTLQASIEYDTISDGTITITGFVDEDDMTSDSATLIPTQQSVKAYVATIAGQSNNVVGLTSTAAELNKLDASAVTPATVTLAASDGFVINDISATETKVALISDIDTYVSSSTATLTNKTLTSPIVTGLHLNDSGFTVEGSSADDNETTVSFANPTADRTVTIPDATGTVLLDSNIGTSVQAYDANLTSFVTALTLPTADGTAGQFLKTDGAGTVSFASIPTINTLNDIGNVTITSAASGEFLQWNGSAWVNATVEAFDTQTHTTTATTQVSIAEYAHATYDGVKAVITADDGTNRSITEILITHNGTTAVATEYAQVNTNTALATFDVDISGTDIRILATPAAATSTSFTVKAITL